MTDDEYFDVYDAMNQPTGERKERDAVHRDGDWHRSVHLWIYNPDGEILFQRRAASKSVWPLRLDASVGGHIRAGEGEEGLIREAFEELGMTIGMEDVVAIGTRQIESLHESLQDCEFQHIYVLHSSQSLADYRIDADELDGLAYINGDDAVAIHSHHDETVVAEYLPVSDFIVSPMAFTQRDTIPGRTDYIQAMVAAVEALIDGRTPKRLDDKAIVFEIDK